MKGKTKAEILAHYATREPKRFEQYDAHDLSEGGADDVMHPDEDGFCVMKGDTYELMYACAVRVLVEPDAPPERVVMGLRKIVEWIESDIKRAADAGMTVAQLKAKDIEKLNASIEAPMIPDLSNVAAWLEGSDDPVLQAAGGMIWLRINAQLPPAPADGDIPF